MSVLTSPLLAFTFPASSLCCLIYFLLFSGVVLFCGFAYFFYLFFSLIFSSLLYFFSWLLFSFPLISCLFSFLRFSPLLFFLFFSFRLFFFCLSSSLYLSLSFITLFKSVCQFFYSSINNKRLDIYKKLKLLKEKNKTKHVRSF